MAANKIEQLIDEIYEFIEGCKMQPWSQTKVVVPRDELFEYLDELRMRTPEEIKRYQKIIANREAIIRDAEEKAQKIQEEAVEKAKTLVNENEITQQAFYQANEIVQNATAQAEAILGNANNDAEQIRKGVLEYTNDILQNVERIMTVSYEECKSRSESLMSALEKNMAVISGNRKEILEQMNPGSTNTEESQSQQAEGDDDFDFDPDTFIKNIE